MTDIPYPMISDTEQFEENTIRVLHRALGLFATLLVEQLADGRQRFSYSRWHRKGLPPIELASNGYPLTLEPTTNPWLQLWAPGRLAWWIAVLFVIGSACFAIGGFASSWPGYCPEVLTDGSAVNITFFVGSLFFTSAAWLQLAESINGDISDIGSATDKDHRKWRWLAWKPGNAGYSASLIQFAGTLLFNLNTGDAMLSQLTWRQEDALIWTPDVIGSICFLVSSYIALIEVSHRFWSFQPRLLSWWIVVINLLGSVAFMVSAVFNFFLPGSGDAWWVWGAGFYTFLGALCFLIASYLMIPEQAGAARSIDPTNGSWNRQGTEETATG